MSHSIRRSTPCRMTHVALLIVILSGCQSAVTPSATSPLAATATVAPVPPPTPPASTPTIAPAPSPSTPPTIEELASAYLHAATTSNKAFDAAIKTYNSSSKSLKPLRRLASAYTSIQLAFIRAVQSISWWGDAKGIARRLLTCDNEVYVYYASAAKEKTYSSMVADLNKGDAKSVRCSGIANELRLAIGLPPLPIT